MCVHPNLSINVFTSFPFAIHQQSIIAMSYAASIYISQTFISTYIYVIIYEYIYMCVSHFSSLLELSLLPLALLLSPVESIDQKWTYETNMWCSSGTVTTTHPFSHAHVACAGETIRKVFCCCKLNAYISVTSHFRFFLCVLSRFDFPLEMHPKNGV